MPKVPLSLPSLQGYDNFKMGQKKGYKLNYQVYSEDPLETKVRERKVRKVVFTDGMDHRYRLTEHNPTKEEIEEKERQAFIENQKRLLKKPGLLLDKDKSIRLIKE